MPQTFFVPSCAFKPVHTHTHRNTLRLAAGSESLTVAPFWAPRVSADDHTPAQLDPIKTLLYTPTFNLSIFTWLSLSDDTFFLYQLSFLSLSRSIILFHWAVLCICVFVCVREGQTAHRQEILQLWELISGMHVLSQMKAAQITH